ncbi:MAG: MarR family winged helix-turn-helix transcriptional regulator [Jatrophihabitantaceae bacterium]
MPHPELPDNLPDNLDALEREFRRFAMNLSRYKHQIGDGRLDRLALIILGTLSHCGPSRLSPLAERCGFDPSTASRQVADLEKAGLLERSTDPEDRRAVLLKASPKGKRLLQRLEAGRRQRLQRLVGDWTEPEIATFATLLGRLNAASEQHFDQNTDELRQELNHG